MGARVVSLPGGQVLGEISDKILIQNGVGGGRVLCKDVRTIQKDEIDGPMDAAIFEVII